MATKAPTVVYVHGGGRQEPNNTKELLKGLDTALDLKKRAPSRLARYDQIRHRRPRPKEDAAIQEASDTRLSPEVAASVLVDAIEPAPGFRVPPSAREFARQFLAKHFQCLDSKAAREMLDEAARIQYREWLSEAVLDAVAYLWFGWADRMRAPVAATIVDVEGPLVIVGHSLGSIVTHDVLSGGRLTDDVRLLLTAGSPLGMPLVQMRLVGRLLCFTRVPRPVKAWVNTYDCKDPVSCVDPTLKGEFHPVRRVRDLPPVVNTAPNHHDLTGYLRVQAVRDVVMRALGPAA